MKNRLPVLLLCLSIAGTGLRVGAQMTGSTLATLTDRASAIATVRITESRHHSGFHRVTLAVASTLKGQLPREFVLSEPSGPTCGHALHGVAVGTAFVAFTETGPTGVKLVVSSERSLVALDARILAHLRALLSARTSTSRLAVLAQGLASDVARVRQDAALTLYLHRDLETSTLAIRRKILAALDANLGKDDPTAFGLLRATTRLGMREAVDVLLPHYLASRSGGLQELVQKAIPALDSARAVNRLWTHGSLDIAAQKRAIRLLGSCHGAAAAACLQGFTTSSSASVAHLAQETLKARESRSESTGVRFRSILQRTTR